MGSRKQCQAHVGPGETVNGRKYKRGVSLSESKRREPKVCGGMIR